MADYECWPLWDERCDNIDPANLPISEQLKADLTRWALRLDAGLNWDDPAATVWPDMFRTAFDDEGDRLAQRLQAELGGGWTISHQATFRAPFT